MKKNLAIIGLAALMVGTTFACSEKASAKESVKEVQETTTELTFQDMFAYKPYTPQENIVEGDKTAADTISNFVGHAVTVGEEYHVTPCVSGYMAFDENDMNKAYVAFQAIDYEADKYSILFLLDDDTKAVEATPTSKAIVKESYMVCSDYQSEANSHNSCNGAVASLYDGTASIVLNNESGYCLTSIWGYDKTNETVYLVWVNHDCPIWANHF